MRLIIGKIVVDPSAGSEGRLQKNGKGSRLQKNGKGSRRQLTALEMSSIILLVCTKGSQV